MASNETAKKEESFSVPLIANFVHQVINPLSGIAGTLDNIIDGSLKEESRRKQKTIAARAQLEQCISLVRNLAYFAEGFQKRPPHDLTKTVIPQCIIEAAQFYQEEASSKNIRINLTEKNDQIAVYAKPEILKQVFMNIFDNCVKYSERDSIVEVHQRIQKRTGDALITIKSLSAKAFGAKDQHRIFELGYRGQNAVEQIASGSGLGMFICKKIVGDVYGGTISIQISGDKIIEFFIAIPNALPPT